MKISRWQPVRAFVDHLEERGREKAGGGKRTSFQGGLDCVIIMLIVLMIMWMKMMMKM